MKDLRAKKTEPKSEKKIQPGVLLTPIGSGEFMAVEDSEGVKELKAQIEDLNHQLKHVTGMVNKRNQEINDFKATIMSQDEMLNKGVKIIDELRKQPKEKKKITPDQLWAVILQSHSHLANWLSHGKYLRCIRQTDLELLVMQINSL